VLEPDGNWNDYLQAMSGFPTGTGLERISVADYIVYDAASTGCNWPAPAGYGSLVAASLPRAIDSRLSTPVESIELDLRAVVLGTAGWRRSHTCCDPHCLDGCGGRRHDHAPG
jgi:monoamine oxidase